MPRSKPKIHCRLLRVLLPIHQSFPIQYPQPVVALAVPLIRTSLKPHLRHREVLRDTLAPEVHPADIARSEGGPPRPVDAVFVFDYRSLCCMFERLVRGVLGPE
jgi:hypothetical protein